MLTPKVVDAFALEDTQRQVSILHGTQLLDTPAGDEILGHLAGSHPERYRALIVALARREDGAQ